jgi:hypothetical protein
VGERRPSPCGRAADVDLLVDVIDELDPGDLAVLNFPRRLSGRPA